MTLTAALAVLVLPALHGRDMADRFAVAAAARVVGPAAGRHARPAARRPRRSIRRLAISARDAATLRVFATMVEIMRAEADATRRERAEVARLAAMLTRAVRLNVRGRGADETGPAFVTPSADRLASLWFICALNDAVAAQRYNAQLRASGITGLVGVV